MALATEPFSSPEDLARYLRAGAAVVTLVSRRTGTRYTYRVRAAEGEQDARGAPRFVDLLHGPDNTRDYRYLGMIRGGDFFTTKATRHMESAAFTQGFRHFYRNLARANRIPHDVEAWHSSRCGRCGRALTVPASVASGLGPECAGRVQ